MGFKSFVNRYIPTALLPRRYNVERQIRAAFQNSAERTIEQALEVTGQKAEIATHLIDRVDQKYGDRILASMYQSGEGRAKVMAAALAFLVQAIMDGKRLLP